MRHLKFPTNSIYWMNAGLTGIANQLQRGVTALKEYVAPSPTLFSQAFDDPAYSQHLQWREVWLLQLKLLQQVLSNYPISANAFDQMLGAKWTALLSRQAGVSFFEYQKGLQWLDHQLAGNSMAIPHRPVIQYHQKAAQEFLEQDQTNATQFFYDDLMNFLIRHSLHESSSYAVQKSDTVRKLLTFYKPVISADLFHTIEKVVLDGLKNIDAQGNATDFFDTKKARYHFRLVRALNRILKPFEQSLELQNPMGLSITSALFQAARTVREHPLQVFTLALAAQASTAAAQNTFRINDEVNGTQTASTVAAFPSGGFVTAFQGPGLPSSVFARTFDNSGVPMDVAFPLTGNTTNDQRPSVATFPDDTFIAAWERLLSGPDWDVFARRFNGSTPIGPEFRLSMSGTDDQRRPVVTTLPNGEFAATWDHFAGGAWSVRRRNFDLNDLPIDTELQVSGTPSSNPRNPAIATLPSDDTVVVWEDNDVREVSDVGSTNIGDMIAGGGLAAAFNGITSEGATSAESGASNNAFVGKDWGVGVTRTLTGTNTWGRNDAGYINLTPLITTRVYGSNSLPASATDGTVVATVINNLPDTAASDNFQSLMTGFDTSTPYRYHWLGMTSTVPDVWWVAELEFFETIRGIFARSYNGTGIPTTSEFQLNTYILDIQSMPTVAAFPEAVGGYATAWNSLGQDGSSNGVYFQRYDNSSSPIGPTIRVNTETMDNQQAPSIATLSGGRSVAVWESEGGQDGSGSGVYGQFIDASSTPIGNEFLVNQHTNGSQTSPKVALLSDDNLMVTWSGEGADDNDGVFGRVIDTSLSATATNQTLNYQENMPVSFASIVVTPPSVINDVTMTLSLSDISAGTLPTGTSGVVTSTYNSGTGVWEAIGPVDDVNNLLAALQFNPNFGFTGNLTIAVNIQDGLNIFNDTISVFNDPTPTMTATGAPTSSTTGVITGTSTSTTGPTNSEPVSSSDGANSGGLSGAAVAGIAVGIVAACLATMASIVGLLLWRKSHHDDVENLTTPLQDLLPPTHYSEDHTPAAPISTGHSLSAKVTKTRLVIGDKYELFEDITAEEADLLFQQTGVRISVPADKKRVEVDLGKKGNFGKIGLARNIRTGEFVAVKTVEGTKKVQESKNEVEVWKRLQSLPNILPLFDSVEIEDDEHQPVLYQFMPFAGFGSGEVLREKLNQLNLKPRVKFKLLGYVARELLTGLEGMHGRQISHKDIKPDNFVLSSTGAEAKAEAKARVSLIDFGCAKDRSTSLKKNIQGDSGYIPPEVFAFCRGEVTSFDPSQWDTWSLGVTLVELALGKYPFPKEKIVDGEVKVIGFKTRYKEWTPDYFSKLLGQIPELYSPVPGSFWDLVGRLLVVDPRERLSIEGALKHPALQGVLSSNGVAEVLERLRSGKVIQHVPKERDLDYIPRNFEVPPPKPGAYISLEPAPSPAAPIGEMSNGFFAAAATSVSSALPRADEEFYVTGEASQPQEPNAEDVAMGSVEDGRYARPTSVGTYIDVAAAPPGLEAAAEVPYNNVDSLAAEVAPAHPPEGGVEDAPYNNDFRSLTSPLSSALFPQSRPQDGNNDFGAQSSAANASPH